jgi:hypothetical protein
VCIPSSYSYRDFVIMGSTPLTDERFSTEYLQIVHDGAELERAEKVARLIEWDPDLVLAHLRVCALNYGGPYNCGRCWKCVRTMIPLQYLGVLDRAATFPDKSTAHWAAVAEADSLPFVEENLRFGQAHWPGHELTLLLERIVRRRRYRQAMKTAVESSPLRPLLPALLAARRRLRATLGASASSQPAADTAGTG